MTPDPVHPGPHRRIVVALIVAVAALLGPSAPPAGAAHPATPEEWVTLIYRFRLHRDPTPADVDHWLEDYDHIHSVQNVVSSIGWGQESLGPTIDDAYAWILDRPADPDGRTYWSERIRNRGPLHDVERRLLASGERYAASGGTDASFVADLYDRILDRPGGPTEHAYWVGRLASGEHRVRTVDALLASPEGREARVARIADALFDEPPTDLQHDEAEYGLRTFHDPRHAFDAMLEHSAPPA